MIDGQNLYHAAREAFGQKLPTYDALALAQRICKDHDWELAHVGFYTGVPPARENPNMHDYWSRKLLRMSRQGVHVFTRELRYRNVTFRSDDGFEHKFRTPVEKGIDIRIALDLLRHTQERKFDVAVLFSQDQDFTEAVTEVKALALSQGRSVRVMSAFPTGPAAREGLNLRGINGTDWIKVPWSMYRECLDPMRYPRLDQPQVAAPAEAKTPGPAHAPAAPVHETPAETGPAEAAVPELEPR